MEPMQVVRPLGLTEQFLYSRSSLGLYQSVGVTASYHYSHSGPGLEILKLLIYSSLAEVIAVQPQLSVVPVNRSSGPYFARITEIDLNSICMFCERTQQYDIQGQDGELESLLETQHNLPFRHTSPVTPHWRLVISLDPSDDTIFTASLIFNHVLFDTRSALIFHQSFAAALSRTGLRPLNSTMVLTPNVALLPAFEELYDSVPSQDILDELKQKLEAPPEFPDHLWSGGPQKLPLKSRIKCIYIDKETSRNFMVACRINGTSVTAALEILLAAKLFEALPESFESIRCSNAISLRPWLRQTVDPTQMGVFVSTYEDYFHRQDFLWEDVGPQVVSFSWDQARQSKERIKAIQANRGAGTSMAVFSVIDDFNHFHISRMGKKRPTAFDLSNIGVLPSQPEDQCWKLGTVVFSQSASVCGAAFRPNVATGGDGRQTISYVWQQNVVDESLMERIIEKVTVGIKELAASSSQFTGDSSE